MPKAHRGRGGGPQDAPVDPELAALRQRLREHPAHGVADREVKVRTAERYLRVEADNAKLRRKVEAATNSLARTFDRIVGLLAERGFITTGDDAEHSEEEERRYDTTGDDAERSEEEERRYDTTGDGDPQVTADGRMLARIYSESDLLVAECLRTGAWHGLAPAELAAVVSTVLYESRGADGPGGPPMVQPPTEAVRRALYQTRKLAASLRADERRHGITAGREPDDGFVAAVYRWARTGDLASALDASDAAGAGSPLSAGDFVRWCRQVLDLLDQLRNAAPEPELRATAKQAIDTVLRGVVAVDAG